MIPVIGYSTHRAWCKKRGPDVEGGHTHECIGPGHGYDEHLCECGDWFKVAPEETRTARVPDSARSEEST